MARLTAIEFGADTCVLVNVTVRRDVVQVSAVETLSPAAFPGGDAFIEALRQARKKLKLPRRARVVLWGRPEGTDPGDPAGKQMLQPIRKAGFWIDRVVSPSNALAAMARLPNTRGDGATGWLALDRCAVAFVIVRPGEQLYLREFPWDSSMGAVGSQARLLQRYSLVAFLAPEVRHGIALAREKGARVDTIITCGNLPDLRSLTMPLIEELDIEVETLDSLEGIEMQANLRDRLAELAPAIRLACAGAVTRATRVGGDVGSKPKRSFGPAIPVAAALVAAMGLGWWWYSRDRTPPATVGALQKAPAAMPPGSSGRSAPLAVRPAAARPSSVTPPAQGTQGRGAAASAPPERGQRPKPQPVVPVPQPKPAPSSTAPASRDSGRAAVDPGPVAERGRADSPDASHAPARGGSDPDLLKDPLPQVTTILISHDRRLAMLDGRIVKVGDTVGQRVVSAIEPRVVVLREPSGVKIRVALGGRLVGVDRLNRD